MDHLRGRWAFANNLKERLGIRRRNEPFDPGFRSNKLSASDVRECPRGTIQVLSSKTLPENKFFVILLAAELHFCMGNELLKLMILLSCTARRNPLQLLAPLNCHETTGLRWNKRRGAPASVFPLLFDCDFLPLLSREVNQVEDQVEKTQDREKGRCKCPTMLVPT